MVLGYKVLMQNHTGSNPQPREPGAHSHPNSCLQGPPQGEGESLLLYRPTLLGQERPAFRAGGRGAGTLRCGPRGERTVVLILPFSVVMLSRWCRCAKGLAAPQDSRYRVMRTEALILAPSRVWRGLKRWGLLRSPLGWETKHYPRTQRGRRLLPAPMPRRPRCSRVAPSPPTASGAPLLQGHWFPVLQALWVEWFFFFPRE